MKKPELFHKTVGILVNAYLNDTLVHGICAACAVGNLVAANCGFKFDKALSWHNQEGPVNTYWDNVFMTMWGQQSIYPGDYVGEAKKQIDSTGYSFLELAKIEKSFETTPKRKLEDEWNYNGLMAVVDTLCEIHEINDTTKQETKALFVKPVTF